jgi:Xaa-Pro aminopeptidase
MHKARLQKLRARMEQAQMKALLITSPVNRKYMTGFTGSAGVVLITLEQAYLITDFRYMIQAPEEAKAYEVLEHKPGQMLGPVEEKLNALHIDKLGFEQHHLTYAEYVQYSKALQGKQLIPVSELVEQLRAIKDVMELKVIQEAAELADRTFSHIQAFLKPGAKESDIALEIEFFMRKNGAASSSFETIVASGERSALPHGVASDRILGMNEFVKLDFGANYQDYCSDITRTVFLGKPTDKHKEIYTIVQEAQQTALDKLKPGMTGKEADAAAREVIKKYGYGDQFGHGLGHGIGMEVHEAPRLSPQSNVVLEPGMVVTVEPGIYIPQFGGVRIEDDVVITETGIQIYTHSTKQFVVLES